MSRHQCQRIGHGGASALVPGNTLASFDAALEVGVDMIEFDVRACRGELVLAHTVLDARRGGCARLEDALAHVSVPRFGDVKLNVDLKHVGCESALLDRLRRAHVLERTLISSQVAAVLDRVRQLEPRARTGISVGGRLARISRRWRDWRTQVLTGLATRRWDVLMAQHRLIDAGLLADVVGHDGHRGAIEALRGLGVHGITTADPRLFAPRPAEARAGSVATQGVSLDAAGLPFDAPAIP
jgi:glycerophosphoryl diester phosphodiesterase